MKTIRLCDEKVTERKVHVIAYDPYPGERGEGDVPAGHDWFTSSNAADAAYRRHEEQYGAWSEVVRFDALVPKGLHRTRSRKSSITSITNNRTSCLKKACW